MMSSVILYSPNGCNHCPYDYEKVREPKRSGLLSMKDERQ